MTHSPPLHHANSTFLTFTLTFEPPSHITSILTLEREAQRRVREINVVAETHDVLLHCDEGYFANPEVKVRGRVPEPDHRMWAARCLCLRDGRDGLGGPDDYVMVEAMGDDGERFGGERVMRALREHRGVDVLAVCCRWVRQPSSLGP